jgi:hypothetical protein
MIGLIRAWMSFMVMAAPVLANVPLGDHKLHTVEMSGLVGSQVENRPGDVLRGGELVAG